MFCLAGWCSFWGTDSFPTDFVCQMLYDAFVRATRGFHTMAAAAPPLFPRAVADVTEFPACAFSTLLLDPVPFSERAFTTPIDVLFVLQNEQKTSTASQ